MKPISPTWLGLTLFTLGNLIGCAEPNQRISPLPNSREFCVDGRADRLLHYLDEPGAAGRLDALPIVFVAGLGGGTFSWDLVVEPLRSHRLIRVDLLGHGRSSKPFNFDYSMASQAAAVRQLIDSLHLDSYVLVGASYGGGVALELALAECERSPSRLRGLVLIGAAGLDFPPPPTIRLARDPLLNWWTEHITDAKALARILLAGSFYRDDRIPAPLLDAMTTPLRPRGTRRALRQAAIEMFDELEGRKSEPQRYAAISCPALLIWGDHDRTVPRKVMQRLSKTIPHATSQTIADCGHSPHEECPEKLLTCLGGFVAGLPR
ncbi:MAG: alpha/beta hydrolase [Planctomycetes bacterium]|nr:alpha/beta hydrolase [Planctomycetota bacterium]